MRDNVLVDKSITFAVRVIKLHKYLIKTKKETIISKQIARSGTSIGANINEANYGQSKVNTIFYASIDAFRVCGRLKPDLVGCTTKKKVPFLIWPI